MKLENYRLVFLIAGLIGILLIASFSLRSVISVTKGEHFSELYLIGPEHKASNYPYNVAINRNYSVNVAVVNHLGFSAYYALYVKIRNLTDHLPNATTGTPSSLQPIYEYRFLVQNGQTWESELEFSILDVSINSDQSLISRFIINEKIININKPSIWVSNSTTYFYQLLLELWVYDSQSGSIGFHNRYVNLQFNITNGEFSG
jgi:hypothetical protein